MTARSAVRSFHLSGEPVEFGDSGFVFPRLYPVEQRRVGLTLPRPHHHPDWYLGAYHIAVPGEDGPVLRPVRPGPDGETVKYRAT